VGRRAASCAALILAALSCPPVFAQAAGDPTGQPPAPSTPPTTPWYQTISLNGLVSTSYVVNVNSPASRTNQFRVFDTDDRTAKLDVVELAFQRPVTKPGDVGFRADGWDDARDNNSGMSFGAQVALTPEFRPHQVLVVRGDLRRDWSDKAVFELADGTFGRSQVTVSINALFVF
jgi:hypothetical protein